MFIQILKWQRAQPFEVLLYTARSDCMALHTVFVKHPITAMKFKILNCLPTIAVFNCRPRHLTRLLPNFFISARCQLPAPGTLYCAECQTFSQEVLPKLQLQRWLVLECVTQAGTPAWIQRSVGPPPNQQHCRTKNTKQRNQLAQPVGPMIDQPNKKCGLLFLQCSSVFPVAVPLHTRGWTCSAKSWEADNQSCTGDHHTTPPPTTNLSDQRC